MQASQGWHIRQCWTPQIVSTPIHTPSKQLFFLTHLSSILHRNLAEWKITAQPKIHEVRHDRLGTFVASHVLHGKVIVERGVVVCQKPPGAWEKFKDDYAVHMRRTSGDLRRSIDSLQPMSHLLNTFLVDGLVETKV